MNNPKSFKDFGIKPQARAFTGDKIDLVKILNTEVIVHECAIKPSTKNAGQCLHMQIEHRQEKRVVFTGAAALIDVARQLPQDAFPFKTTIVKNDQRYEFT
jgi:hypothetical protein